MDRLMPKPKKLQEEADCLLDEYMTGKDPDAPFNHEDMIRYIRAHASAELLEWEGIALSDTPKEVSA